ncbi:MAG TPA: hypothetical protein VLI39_05285 [Sedimentisphaerales bacterium]|nr:hypothetical protein [Sedimentisphaerales bacterium]
MESIHLPLGLLLLLGTCSLSAQSEAVHWNQFRGPNGTGRADGFLPPLKIDAEKARWKTALPAGKSSPVLWENRIFLTAVEAERLVTLAVDAGSGKVLWPLFAQVDRATSRNPM